MSREKVVDFFLNNHQFGHWFEGNKLVFFLKPKILRKKFRVLDGLALPADSATRNLGRAGSYV